MHTGVKTDNSCVGSISWVSPWPNVASEVRAAEFSIASEGNVRGVAQANLMLVAAALQEVSEKPGVSARAVQAAGVWGRYSRGFASPSRD